MELTTSRYSVTETPYKKQINSIELKKKRENLTNQRGSSKMEDDAIFHLSTPNRKPAFAIQRPGYFDGEMVDQTEYDDGDDENDNGFNEILIERPVRGDEGYCTDDDLNNQLVSSINAQNNDSDVEMAPAVETDLTESVQVNTHVAGSVFPPQPCDMQPTATVAAAAAAAAATTSVPNIVPEKREILFYDDEQFSPEDNIARRRIYSRIQSKSLFAKNRGFRVSYLNITADMYECEGATQFYQLKDEYFNVLATRLHSYGYAISKKPRITPSVDKIVPSNTPKKGGGTNPGGRKKSGSLSSSSSSIPRTEESPASSTITSATTTTPHESATSTDAGDMEGPYLQGNNDLSIVLETLVSDNMVVGNRFCFIDRSMPKDDTDFLSQGLKETISEAELVKEVADKQIASITKSLSKASSKKSAPKTFQLTKEFGHAHYPTFDSHFMGVIKPYFANDPCFSFSETDNDTNRQKFTDSRPFIAYDALGLNVLPNNNEGDMSPVKRDHTKLSHPCNITSLFNKNYAMNYYVRSAGVNEEQCQLSSYYDCPETVKPANKGRKNKKESSHMEIDLSNNDISMDIESDMDDNESYTMLDVGIPSQTPDKLFKGFPYENITYHVDNLFGSHEFVSRAPLPHRMGTFLYTDEDDKNLRELAGIDKRVDDDDDEDIRVGNDDDDDDDDDADANNNSNKKKPTSKVNYGRSRRTFYGLHETEYEFTSATMQNELYHLDKQGVTSLNLPNIPTSVLEKYKYNKTNEIDSQLKLILSNLGHKGRVVITEKITEPVNGAKRSPPLKIDFPDCQSNVMNINGHHPLHPAHLSAEDAVKTGPATSVPYVANTLPGLINNRSKDKFLKKKAFEYKRLHNTLGESEKQELREYQEREYQSKVASGNPNHFKDIVEKYRPWGNSMEVIKTQLPNTRVDLKHIGRDHFLGLAALNDVGHANFAADHATLKPGQSPEEKDDEYLRERGKFIDGLVVEWWDVFFKSPLVSMACEGVRSDMLKQHNPYISPSSATKKDKFKAKKTIGRKMPVYEYNHELRPYAAFRVWVHSFFADQGCITYNYKTVSILYFSKFHHCRWFPRCNNPKLNIILSGSGMAGKSHLLQLTKETCPTSVGDMVTHITDQAFNVDRNMNDMLLIYEEMQNKYLGYNGNNNKNSGSGGGNGGGVSSGSDKDTINFFKSRLTNGMTTTFSWFENEETGLRDMKISHSHCQGNLLAATNNDLSEADMNVLSRLILISVAKSKLDIPGYRPQDRNKTSDGKYPAQDEEMFEQQKEVHRAYFMLEQLVKSNVLGDDEYGVYVDGAKIMITAILDELQTKYGIPTNDIRKRNHVLELARCMCMAEKCWFGLTSNLTRHLQHDPHDETNFIGFNPRVIIEGILPFLVVTIDHVVDAITALSCLWYHDFQDLILEVFATKLCKLQELREEDFMVRRKKGTHVAGNDRGGGDFRKTGYSFFNSSSDGSNSSSSAIGGSLSRSNGGGNNNPYANADQHQHMVDEIDYNYIKISGKTLADIAQLISLSTGDTIVAPNDILKLFTDLSRSYVQDLDSYEMETYEEDGKVKYRLVRSKEEHKNKQHRKVVEMTYCDGKPTIAVQVHFLFHKLGHLFPPGSIANLDTKDDDDEDDLVMEQEDRTIDIDDNDEDDDEEDDAFGDEELRKRNRFYKSVRDVGVYTEKTAPAIIKAIKGCLENSAYGNRGANEREQRIIYENHVNPVTKRLPWDLFITADHPKEETISNFYPELTGKDFMKKTSTSKRKLLFVDKLKMLPLKNKKSGKNLIIQNYNTISMSTKKSLSIHSDRNRIAPEDEPHRQGTKTKRLEKYAKTASWIVDKDIDFTSCKEHLRNIGHKRLKTADGYAVINYPPDTYMAIMDDKRRREGDNFLLDEYPFCDNLRKIVIHKKQIDGIMDPSLLIHEKYSEYMETNLSSSGTVNGTAFVCEPINRSLSVEKQRYEAYYSDLLT